jgi:hypothetical protein
MVEAMAAARLVSAWRELNPQSETTRKERELITSFRTFLPNRK